MNVENVRITLKVMENTVNLLLMVSNLNKLLSIEQLNFIITVCNNVYRSLCTY